jgi:hypothetical protein
MVNQAAVVMNAAMKLNTCRWEPSHCAHRARLNSGIRPGSENRNF